MVYPVLAYYIFWLISLAPTGPARDIIIAIRAGIGFSYGVQFAFMCCINFVAFFGAGAYNGYTIFGTLIALALLVMLWVEVIMFKQQVNNNRVNFMCVEKNKGMSTFDILPESGDKRIRDYKNWFFNEVDGLLLAAMIIGGFGRYFLIQTILLLIVSVLIVLSILMIKQQFKIWKMMLSVLFVALNLVILIFYFSGREVALSTVELLTIVFLIVFFLMIIVNVIIWILRLLDLLQSDIRLNRRDDIYLEKAPRKPQNEIVTYQREEDVAKISKSPRNANVSGANVSAYNFQRDVQDRSVYENRSDVAGQRVMGNQRSVYENQGGDVVVQRTVYENRSDVVGRASPNVSGFVPYRESSEKKSFARVQEESFDNLNQSVSRRG